MVEDEFPRSSFVATFIRIRFCANHCIQWKCRNRRTRVVCPGAVNSQFLQTTPSLESSREPVVAVVPQLQLGLLAPQSPLICPCRSLVFNCLPFVGLLRSQTGSLGATNIPCSSCLSSTSANKQLPCWHWDSDSGFDLCLLSCRSCHHVFPVPAFLAALAKDVHINWI